MAWGHGHATYTSSRYPTCDLCAMCCVCGVEELAGRCDEVGVVSVKAVHEPIGASCVQSEKGTNKTIKKLGVRHEMEVRACWEA